MEPEEKPKKKLSREDKIILALVLFLFVFYIRLIISAKEANAQTPEPTTTTVASLNTTNQQLETLIQIQSEQTGLLTYVFALLTAWFIIWLLIKLVNVIWYRFIDVWL